MLANGKEGDNHGSKNLLIVEDEPKILETIEAYRKKGIYTKTGEDGYKAMELHQSFQLDLVILDLMLPGARTYCVVAAKAFPTCFRLDTHGAEIKSESILGEGATFQIRFEKAVLT